MSEVQQAFAASAQRQGLLRGLLAYRRDLMAAGITAGFQVIDGSFTEDSERTKGRPPNDIDLVTFAHLPVQGIDVGPFIIANEHLFNPARTKALYSCDAYFVDFGKPPHLLVADTAYWFGLFSHQRNTALWKGLVSVSLASDDVVVDRALQALLGP